MSLTANHQSQKSWFCKLIFLSLLQMKEKYIKPQLVLVDLDATSISCGMSNDHVYDDDDFGSMNSSAVNQRDMIRISTPNDMEIGDGRQSIF